MKKIAVLGHFGFGKNLLNGQTIKTKTLAKALGEYADEKNILCIDTHGGMKTLFKMMFKLVRVMRKCSDVIMLPAHKGLLVITPMLSFYNLFFKRKLHYVVIGGWIAEYLDKHKITANLLRKSFCGIYVETSGMKDKLSQRKFENVYVMPNFKKLDITETLEKNDSKPYRLCTFSRVSKEKGIEDAIEAIKQINSNEIICTLDIYGQVDLGYKEVFEQMQKTFPDYIKYCGLVSFEKTTEVLKKYYALLFPTYYSGEGFAGTIIDAFAAGIPVVASDWRYNPEIVEHKKNGLIFRHKNIDELKNAIRYLMDNYDETQTMRYFCVEEAKKYVPEEVIKVLFRQLDFKVENK